MTGAMITARYNSVRFPGKVVANLAGKPMLEQIIEKARKVKGIDAVVLSTSNEEYDNVVAETAERCGAWVARGPEKDLYRRHLLTFIRKNLDNALMLSGDSPFFDVEIAERLVIAAAELGPDSCNISLPYSTAVEIAPSALITTSYLSKLRTIVDAHPRHEDIIEQYWILEEQAGIKKKKISVDDILPKEATPIKISIDYPVELALAEKIIEFVGHIPLSYSEVVWAYQHMTSL